MEENVRLALLYDTYGGILTEKQRDIFELYHNEDLSLGEIAENLGISRQGVRDALVHAAAALTAAEEQLHFCEQQKSRSALLKEAEEQLFEVENGNYPREALGKLRDILGELQKLG